VVAVDVTASRDETSTAPLPPTAVGRRWFAPMLMLLGVAVALRAAAMALYFPAVMMSVDTPRFARAMPQDLFGDYWMPAGYPAFLKVLHHLSDHIWVSIAAQHMLGVGVGVAVFLTARRLSAPDWVATVCAAVPLLSGDSLYLEHILMADTFMFAMTVFALAAAVRGLVPRTDWRWLAAAGGLAAAAMLSRNVALVVIPVIALCALLAGGDRRARMLAGGAVLAGAALVIGLYVTAFEVKGGRYLGLSDMRGWNLYARVAPFADCSKFTPPANTRVLCERTPPAQRQGPFEYVWDPNSIAVRNFRPEDPSTGGPLERFAEAAFVHQPGDYLVAVGTDMLRYVEPSAGTQRGYNGQGRDLVSFGFRDPTTERNVTSALRPRYEGTAVHAPGLHTLTVYQNLVRVDRLWLVLALAATVAGLVVARGPLRIGVALFGLSSLGLYLLPTLAISYDFRYGIPPGILLAISGLLGAYGLAARAGWHRNGLR
jgi:hypothetical protein